MDSLRNCLNRRYKIINFDGRSNYHTHTFYCDGKNSPMEMVERAKELNFRCLGFSGHQYSEQDAHYAMSHEAEQKYARNISDIQRSLEGSEDDLKVYLGLERDYCSEVTPGYQFIIGSTHHVKVGDVWMNVDESSEELSKSVGKLFDGDYIAYTDSYYELEGGVLEKTRGQIVGHFDLVTVFNEGNRFFDENDPAYKRAALRSADKIIDSFISNNRSGKLPDGLPEELAEAITRTGMPIFEINTGAMAKGRRSVPYPAPFIIEHLADIGVPMILSSDCHNRDFLDYGFKEIMRRYDS